MPSRPLDDDCRKNSSDLGNDSKNNIERDSIEDLFADLGIPEIDEMAEVIASLSDEEMAKVETVPGSPTC